MLDSCDGDICKVEDSIKEVQDKFPYLNNQMQKIEEQIDIITSDIEAYKLEFKKKGGD